MPTSLAPESGSWATAAVARPPRRQCNATRCTTPPRQMTSARLDFINKTSRAWMSRQPDQPGIDAQLNDRLVTQQAMSSGTSERTRLSLESEPEVPSEESKLGTEHLRLISGVIVRNASNSSVAMPYTSRCADYTLPVHHDHEGALSCNFVVGIVVAKRLPDCRQSHAQQEATTRTTQQERPSRIRELRVPQAKRSSSMSDDQARNALNWTPRRSAIHFHVCIEER